MKPGVTAAGSLKQGARTVETEAVELTSAPFLVESGVLAAMHLPPMCRLPFSALSRAYALDYHGADKVVPVDFRFIRWVLDMLADRVFVDEVWYLEFHADIASAIEFGEFRDAKHHYMAFGYIEDRIPHFIAVDDGYYAEHNPDIAAGVLAGEIKSYQWHFERFGFKEGRRPYADWRLF